MRKTPPDGEPFDRSRCSESASRADELPPGMLAYHLFDQVAERFLDLVDDLHDEIDELEDKVEDWPNEQSRRRLSDLRHDLLHIRRTLAPTRDAVRRVVDDRVEVEAAASCSRATSSCTSVTPTTSSCARPRGSSSPATSSPACATTTSRRSPTIRTR